MKLFERLFVKSLQEDNAAGAGGVFGDAPSMGHGGAVGNDDFYNTGSAIIPQGPEKKKKKEKSKKRKNGEIEELIPMQRRPFNTQM